MDERLDLDAERLLSGWVAARHDLSAQLDELTAVGPHAEQQVARQLWLLDDLQEQEYAAWIAYRSYVLRGAPDRQPPRLP